MSVDTFTPATAYLTKPNIVHPGSAAQVTAIEDAARVELSTRRGVSVTGGTIKR